MTSTFSLAQGFHAVVIGGAGDIGAAISSLFCELGATVTATAVNDADLARTPLEPRTGLELTTLERHRRRRGRGPCATAWPRRRAGQLRRHPRARQGIRDRDLY
jgi:NAD(P)-dependent dehydrogenase (short-subunit alcohol dehydrogenase family)